MIYKIEFTAKNLTSNAGFLLLLSGNTYTSNGAQNDKRNHCKPPR
jgi:hypothetical protein